MSRAVSDAPPITRSPPAQHFAALDGLRALAALAVVANHTMWRGDSLLGRVMQALELGHAGVRLFFVLSGFLITGILLRARDGQRAQALKAFFARRVLRIFPLYYAVILAMALVDPLTRETLAWHLGYASNAYIALRGSFPPPPLTHLWSLAVEEQFYLVWPFVMLFASRRALPYILLSITLAAPLVRLAVFSFTGSPVSADLWMPSCLDTLGAGALLAWAWHEKLPLERWLRRILVLGLAGWLVARGLIVMRDFVGLRLVLSDVAYALMFVWAVDRTARLSPRWLQVRPLCYVGEISYGVYVLHLVVPVVLARVFNLHDVLGPLGPVQFLVTTLVTLPLAALSYHAFEKPLLRLKERFPYGTTVGTPLPSESQVESHSSSRPLATASSNITK